MQKNQYTLPLVINKIERSSFDFSRVLCLNKQDPVLTNSNLVDKYKQILLQLEKQIVIQEELQNNLHDKETLCLSIMQILPNPIFWANSSQELEGCNEAFCLFIAQRRPEIVNHKIHSFLPKEIVDILTNGERFYNEKIKCVVECIYKDKEYTLFISASPRRERGQVENGMMVNIADITENSKKDAQIVYHATHDELTGLYNRFEALRRMKDLLKEKKDFAIICLDIDNFRNINQIAIPLGDAYLKIFSQRVRSIFSPHFIARMSGDEFIILMEGCKRVEIKKILDLAKKNLEPPIVIDEYEFIQHCSFSVTLAPQDGDTEENLLRNVFITMENIKNMGGNEIAFFEPSFLIIRKSIERKMGELKKAVEECHIINAYQARISMRNNNVIAFEALARIRKEGGSILMPGEFISMAEDMDLIQALGEQVLINACLHAKQFQNIQKGIAVSVNISAKQFEYDLYNTLEKALVVSGLEPSLLELEITENLMIRDIKKAAKILEHIEDMGIRIAIDDFGKGFSSLYYIKDLPVHTVKIDKDFVQDAINNIRSEAIVATVVQLGKMLNMETVAEGVETTKHLDFIKQYGCTQAQGNFISKPLLEEEACIWLRDFIAK
ncbi:MAG: EAL domain-containing protein [Desulfovibrionaceae bacterium]